MDFNLALLNFQSLVKLNFIWFYCVVRLRIFVKGWNKAQYETRK